MLDELILIGNWNDHQTGNVANDYHEFQLRISGNASLGNNTPFTLNCSIPNETCVLDGFQFTNQLELFKFSEKIRGERPAQWYNVLTEMRQSRVVFDTSCFHRIYQENYLKALFMIYYWIDLALIEVSIDLDAMLHDEVVLEYTGRPTKVDYVYFLSSKVCKKYNNNDSIKELLSAGRLVKCLVNSKNRTVETYFIPAMTMSLRTSILSNEAQELWDSIIQDANSCLKYKFPNND